MQLVKWQPQEIDSQTIHAKIYNHGILPPAKLAVNAAINTPVVAGKIVETVIVKPVVYIIEAKQNDRYKMSGEAFVITMFLFAVVMALILGIGINHLETVNRMMDSIDKMNAGK